MIHWKENIGFFCFCFLLPSICCFKVMVFWFSSRTTLSLCLVHVLLSFFCPSPIVKHLPWPSHSWYSLCWPRAGLRMSMWPKQSSDTNETLPGDDGWMNGINEWMNMCERLGCLKLLYCFHMKPNTEANWHEIKAEREGLRPTPGVCSSYDSLFCLC